MSLPRTTRLARGSLTLLLTYAVLAAAVVIAPLAWGPASARAEEDVLLELHLDPVSPAIARPDTEVRLSGTLSNLSTESAPVHSIRVSTAYRGLDTRAAVQEWAETGPLDTPIVLAEDHIGVALAPGSRVHWFVDVPADALQPGFEFATLPVRVEVMATGPDPLEQTEEGVEPTVGTTVPGAELRTYLPWASVEETAFNPVRLAWVASLALPADADLVDPDDQTRAAAWATAIGPTSRARQLLDALSGTQATFLVDPALTEPLDPVASLTEAVEQPGEDEDDTTQTPTEDPAPSQTPPSATTGADTTGPDAPGAATTEAPASGTTQPTTAGAQTELPGSASGTATPPADTDAPTTAPSEDQDDPTTEPDQPPTPPTTQGAVRDLTAAITQLPEERLWWLPVGDTDTVALLDAGTDVTDIAALVGRAPARELAAPGRTDVAWPVSEEFSDGTVESLQQVWAAAGGATGTAGQGNGELGAVVLPGSVFEEALLTGSAVRSHASGVQLIGYDERLSGIAAASGTEGQDGRAAQRFLAETMAVYQEGPASDRSLVVAIPRTATIDADALRAVTDAAATAPWLQETTVGDLVSEVDAPATTVQQPAIATDGDPEQEDVAGAGPGLGDLTAYSRAGESPLSGSRVSRVETARERVAGASEILAGSAAARRTWSRVLDRQYSVGWRAATQDWAAPLEDAEEVAREILSGLSINPTTINLYADEGLMQITVTNELSVPIEGLQMRVEPGNGRLRVLGQPDPITIGPESRATVQFRARAVAAGQVPLHTSLSTPNGTQVGSVEETVVRVQPTGVWIYWLLGGVAGVILVLGLWRALRPSGTRGRDSATTSAPGPEAS